MNKKVYFYDSHCFGNLQRVDGEIQHFFTKRHFFESDEQMAIVLVTLSDIPDLYSRRKFYEVPIEKLHSSVDFL